MARNGHKPDATVAERSVTTRRVLLAGGAAATLPLLAKAAPALAATDEGTVAQYPLTSARNVIQSQSASVLPLAVKANDGQSTNLQEWQDSSGNVLTAISPRNGRIVRPNTGAGHGPFVWEIGGSSFSGGPDGTVWDPVSYFGYNVGNGDDPIVPGEPVASWTIEADYNDGQKRVIEPYLEIRSADGSVNMRPLFFQLKRDATTPTGMLTGARLVGNPMTFCVPDDTLPHGPGTSPDRAVATYWPHNAFEFYGNDSNDSSIRVGAGTGRAAALMLGSNGTNNVLQIRTVASSIDHALVSNNGQTVLHAFSSPQGAPGASIAVGAQDNQAAGVFDTAPSGTNIKGLVVRGKSGITANLFETQDSSSTVLSGFDKSGYLFTRKTSAPADADVATGQLMLWFDSAGRKLMVKARDANGKIRTGSVALT